MIVYKKIKLNVNLVVEFRVMYFNNAMKILIVKLMFEDRENVGNRGLHK